MAQVSTEGIRETNREISNAVHILRSVARETSSKCSAIKGYASELNGYKGARVKESIYTAGLKDTPGQSLTKYKYYRIFEIDTGNIADIANNLSQRADEVYETVAKILAKVSDIDGIAEAIEVYIEKVQSVLGDNISAKALGAASLAIGQEGIAKANLAKSSDDLKHRNFIDYETFKNDANFSSGKLSFELQEDGSYAVKSNGQLTGYYTSGLTAALYLDTVRTVMTANGEEVAALPHNKSNTISETISSAVENAADRFKNTKGKADNGEEVADLPHVETQDESEEANGIQVTYSNLDDLTSEVSANRKLNSNDSDAQRLVSRISNHKDYLIPSGKKLYSEDGTLIASAGDTVSFDEDNNNFVIKDNTGALRNLSNYNVDELIKGKLSSVLSTTEKTK